MNGQARFCKKCGTPLQNGLYYCTNCGESAEMPMTSTPYYTPTPPENHQKKTCKKCGMTVSGDMNICTNCGSSIDGQPRPMVSYPNYAPNANGYYAPPTQAGGQGYPPEPPVRRKTYTAQKFVAMGFGIGDLLFAFSFFVCGLIFARMPS